MTVSAKNDHRGLSYEGDSASVKTAKAVASDMSEDPSLFEKWHQGLKADKNVSKMCMGLIVSNMLVDQSGRALVGRVTAAVSGGGGPCS